ncbi:TRAP transporter substrate-binding protein [Bacillus sp. FJAT-45350]|uniref:TRAP transporter substrate-binding protein n=1 Tax=Bacillus sp. FJAT-45350 TaxID=2011014 RepID=UPI000BB6FE61|nr:TRAP transporter substrate-binding protein [Bacillus sp. FJAT-45350]
MIKRVGSSKKILFAAMLALFMIFMAACGSQDTAQEQDSGSSDGEANDGGEVVEEGGTHNFMISHFLPGNHPIHMDVLVPFVSDLEEQSNGRITADIYDNNQLGAPGAHYDMTVTGEADIGLSVHAYSAGRFPISTIIDLPFLVDSAEKGGEIFWTLFEEFEELQAEHGETTPLFLFSAEPAQFLSPDKKIETPDDLRGLRVRTPSPAGAQMLEALGATPVTMPMGEVFEALERGAIDAAMVPFSTIADYSFHEVVKYATVGNFSATPFFSVMNTDEYNSLSDSDKALLNDLTQIDMSMHAGRVFDAAGQNGYDEGTANGVEYIELTGENLAAWEDAFQSIIEKWIEDMEAQGVPGQAMYDRALEIRNN